MTLNVLWCGECGMRSDKMNLIKLVGINVCFIDDSMWEYYGLFVGSVLLCDQ